MVERCFSRNEDTPYRIIDGVAMIVNPERGTLCTLNEVGTYIWERVNGVTTMSKVIEDVCDTFEVEKNQAVKDVEEFINDLMSKNMLVLNDK